MTLSYCQQAASNSRFNLWVTIGDHSKVVCWGAWAELIELVDPIMADPVRAVHVLPDGEEPTFSPADLFTDEDNEED